NYMVLGDRFIWRKVPPAFLPGKTDTFHFRNPFIRNTDTGMIARIQYGTIIEYNAKGEIVWTWNSENYLADSDIFPLMFQPMNPTNNHDPHLNAFSVDNADEFVYAGFRQINRVIKIHKKTGKVVNSWGDKMPSGEAATGNGFFYHQHSSQILSNGSIAVFNNGNVAEKEKPSSVVVFSQDTPAKIVWQFDCVYDTFFIKSSRAGNVDELPNQNFLVSTGTKHMGQGPASSIFEVTRNKKIVWMAVVNKFQKALYRAHYISSLYPAYFTAQAIGKWQNGKQQIKLFNEGTEPDLYTVELKFEGSTINERLFAGTVKPGSSLLLNVSPRILPPASSKMEIRVVSKANSNLVRTLNIDITK
ncbi:MAG TPA: aryl-sulfate sulfotransferase, partial [Chitinophagales bacterium]|nr:aryl-sulfate sulfotransferase [Chitinophagales bacterium]